MGTAASNLFDYLQFPYAPIALIIFGLMLWRPVWGLLLLVAVFPMDVYSPRFPVPGINTETILLGLAFAMTILRFGPRLPPLQYSVPLLAFVAMNGVGFALAIPWARKLEFANGSAVWFIFKYWKSITFTAVFFFATYWWFEQPKQRQWLLEALSVGTFISCLAGLADYFLKITATTADGRAAGLQGDPNAMAEALGATMFVCLYLAVYAREIPLYRRVFHGGVYLFSFGMIVFSLSRGNWIALVATHAVFCLFFSRTLFFAGVVTVALFGTVAYPLLPQIVRDRIEVTTHASTSQYRVAGALGLETSAQTRLVFTRIGIDMWKKSPIWGLGLNAFFFRTVEFGAKYGYFDNKDPHNLVIKMLAEGGVLGLAALAYITLAVFFVAWQLWWSQSEEWRLGGIVFTSAFHVTVASLSTDSFLYEQVISAYFWILYAIAARAYVSRYAVAESEARAVAGPRWRRFSQRTVAAASQP
jgi:O-antigen ligase